MVLLTDAIRASDRQIARCAVDGVVVEVERVIGPDQPDDEESYAVRLRRGDGVTEDLREAENLIETLGFLSTLKLPGFAPEGHEWEPVSG